MMKHAGKAIVILCTCLAFPAICEADATTFRVRDDGKSKATFVSDAPLDTMTGETSKVTGSLSVDPSDITKTTGSFQAPVVSLRTGNELRDEHLQGDGWLDAKKYPNIYFEISEIILGKKGSAELKSKKDVKVQVKGKFTAHGITKLVVAKGTVNWSDKTLRIKAEFPVTLEDHEISVPSIVRLKVANEITVSVDLLAVAD
jgi:polyisoprenoid-binding protein YceI